MATVIQDIIIETAAERVWALVGDFGGAANAFPGVLSGCHREGDVRTVTFANGAVVRERLVTLDNAGQRLVYAVMGGRFSQHSASMQVVAEGPDRCRFIWISDFLPDDAEPLVAELMRQGADALRHARG